MSNFKLFQIKAKKLAELRGSYVRLERDLQSLLEDNLKTLLDVQFLKSEYLTSGRKRMDTLGIDGKYRPVIIEYKRSRDQNVVNQALTYLGSLLKNRDSFRYLVLDKIGKEAVQKIKWNSPRLICIAADFSKNDFGAVEDSHRDIALVRYRKFGKDLLLLELLAAETPHLTSTTDSAANMAKQRKQKTVSGTLKSANSDMRTLYQNIGDFILGLGDDVNKKTLLHYFAFRRIKNFACVEIRTDKFLVYLKIKPDKDNVKSGFTRNMQKIPHHSTGDLEVTLRSHEDLERSKDLIRRSYEES